MMMFKSHRSGDLLFMTSSCIILFVEGFYVKPLVAK